MIHDLVKSRISFEACENHGLATPSQGYRIWVYLAAQLNHTIERCDKPTVAWLDCISHMAQIQALQKFWRSPNQTKKSSRSSNQRKQQIILLSDAMFHVSSSLPQHTISSNIFAIIVKERICSEIVARITNTNTASRHNDASVCVRSQSHSYEGKCVTAWCKTMK